MDCPKLKRLILPDGLQTIEQNAVYGCNGLYLVYIPESVTTVAWHAFYFDSSVSASFYCQSSQRGDGWDSSWKYNCYGVAHLYWGIDGRRIDGFFYEIETNADGEKTATILSYDGMEETLILPESIEIDGETIAVTGIGKYAFYGNRRLKSVFIGKNVVSIANYAFQNCPNLSIRCESASRPSDWDSSWTDNSTQVEWGASLEEEDGNDNA